MNVARIPDTAYTAQEIKFRGGSEYADLAETNKFWTPASLVLKDDPSASEDFEDGTGFSIEELNKLRAEKGFFPSLIAQQITKEPRAVLSFERIGEDGESLRDPQVLIFDKEAESLSPSPELTVVLYDQLREDCLRMREENPNLPEYETSFFERAINPSLEKETPEPPEGMRNV